MQTPVVLVVFRRPDITAQVLAEVAQAQPPQLFVIADGPRPDRPEDQALCAETRALFDQVTWPCQVHRNFSDVNMGPDLRTVTGLDWVFSQVETAIILEDDCLPDPSFFRFCEELLQRYHHDTRVMQIAGTNFQLGYQRNTDSYHFSRFPTSTGWATWRRAWACFDYDLKRLPAFYNGGWVYDSLEDPLAARNFTRPLDQPPPRGSYHWDSCWQVTCWMERGLIAVPNVNLITNLGYRPDGTHTQVSDWRAEIQARSLPFPLQHPAFILPDKRADRFTFFSRYGRGRVQRGLGKAWRLWRTYRNRGRW